MGQLRIQLFQSFQVSQPDGTIVRFRTAHTRALLAYLALEPQRAHRRDRLAGLLWPDHAERAALHNLSQTLVNLRTAIGDKVATPPFLLTTYQTLQFNPASQAWIDTAIFAAAQQDVQSHPHGQLANCEMCLQQLQQALNVYRGALLADLTLSGSSLFEEWLLLARERLERQASTMLEQLITALLEREQFAEAEPYARQLVTIDPLQESAHQSLIRTLALAGQRSSALQQFESYRELLHTELGIEPEAELLTLVAQIKAGGFARPAVTLLPPASKQTALLTLMPSKPGHGGRRDSGATSDGERSTLHAAQMYGEIPDVGAIYGRESDLARLSDWLLVEHSRVVLLLGMGGLGKTTLAALASKQLASQFDCVVWHSLLNAPPLHEWLTFVLQALAPEAYTDSTTSLDRRLALLLELLRKQHCLLILDNFESILGNDGYAGSYRAGYEEYGRMIDYIGQHGHQSCLLITSREQPRHVDRLALQTPLVRTLRLGGLDPTAGEVILHNHGLVAASEHYATLVERYSGNPLALRLIAVAVHDLFAGDVAAFLDDAVFVFDDVRAVIEQQFERLSTLERSILLWLAIEREPLTPRALTTHCLYATPQRKVFEALRSLQRRTLLEERGGRFTLSNVVIEYLTDRLIDALYDEIQTGRLDLLNSHGLLRAQGKAYLRQTQQRLLIGPLAERLQAQLGPVQLLEHWRSLLERMRQTSALQPGYAAGNLLNLLVYLRYDLQGLDFSQLCVWEAMLEGITARKVNFAAADLRGAAFTDAAEGSHGMAISPDGNYLVTGTTNGLLRFWSTNTWQPQNSVAAHRICIWHAAFSNSGNLVATASEEPIVKLWNGRTGAFVRALEGHSGAVRAVAFSPDDRLLASSGLDETVRLWDIQSGEQVAVLRGHSAMVRTIAWSPDAQYLASGGDDSLICIWQVATSEVFRTLRGHSDVIKTLAYSPDGRWLISASHDGTVRFWENATGECRTILHSHSDGLTTLACSKDGVLLATAGYDKTIRLWDGTTSRLRHTFEPNVLVRSLVFSADGRFLVSCHDDQTMCVWEAESGRVLQSVQGYMNWVHALAYSPDMSWIATGGADSVVRLWNAENPGYYRDLLDHGGPVNSLAWSPDSRLCASGSKDSTVRLWDVRTGQLVRVFADHSDHVYSVQWSPDGGLIASGGASSTVLIWEASSGHIRWVLRGHSLMINAVAWSPDGRLLATASDDRTVGLWDTSTGELLAYLHGHEGIVGCLAFSPCGQLLASGSYDCSVRLWCIAEQRVHTVYTGHGATVTSLAFSPNGEMLISGSYDQTIRVWQMADGANLAVCKGHTGTVSAVAFCANGQTFISNGFDAVLREWDVESFVCKRSWPMPLPYAGMNITGATGLSAVQRASLLALGAGEGGTNS